jgi:hypothetical protein
VHLFRLPMGVNTKKGRGMFAVRLVQITTRVLQTARITSGTSGPPASGPGPLSPGGDATLEELFDLMDLIPNTFDDRDTWIEIGHGLKALCADDDEGFAVFDTWSATHPSYDPDHTRKAWESFGASGSLKSRGGMLRDRAEKSRAFAAKVFDDGAVHPRIDTAGPGPGPKTATVSLTATPFKWVDLAKTAPRDWLYGDILLRKFISMTVAPGGVGKSSLVAVETLAQVTGKSLLGEDPSDELRVWLWNLEDPYEETQKKILAAAKHYGVSEAEIGDRLFMDSGRDQRLVIAEMDRTGPMIVRPVIRALVEQIRLRKIDVVVIDPFVSSHGVPENDNSAMDMVVKEWGRVAEEGNCAVHLVDHTSKAGSAEVVTDSSRGAKAKTDAARVVRVVNRMTGADGKAFGITDTWRYFNTFNDKANMAPPKARRDWFRMESVSAGNGGSAQQAFSAGAAAMPKKMGDSVGVAVQWTPPSAQIMAAGNSFTDVVKVMGTKKWKAAPQSPDWVGNAIAQGLRMDASVTSEREVIKTILKTWISEGLLKIVAQQDENRKTRDFIEVAQVF